MANAHVLIQSQILGSAVASVTFGSGGTLPQTYRDLIIVMTTPYTGSATAMGASWRVNGDGGNNYNRVDMEGNGSSTVSYSAANETVGYGISATNTNLSNTIMHFFDYSATDKHKTMLSRTNDSAGNVTAYAGRWASTAAITSIVLYAPDAFSGVQDTWSTGATFYLYGVLA